MELTGKMLLVGKSQALRYLAHRQRPFTQQDLTFLNADFCQILARRHAELCPESAVHVGHADMRGVRKLRQRKLAPGIA